MNRENRKDAIVTIHKQNIMTAAKEIFISKGYDKTTMDDISAQAQYSKRTVYTYFASKEQIFSTIILGGITELMLKIHEAYQSQGDFVERYFNICKTLSDFYNESPTYFNGILEFQNRATSFINESPENENIKAIFDVGEQINMTIENFLKSGQLEGIILNHIDLKKTVLYVWNTMLSIIVLSGRKGEYIQTVTESSQWEFSRFGFQLLLNSILA